MLERRDGNIGDAKRLGMVQERVEQWKRANAVFVRDSSRVGLRDGMARMMDTE